jgi:hypothetical protein
MILVLKEKVTGHVKNKKIREDESQLIVTKNKTYASLIFSDVN